MEIYSYLERLGNQISGRPVFNHKVLILVGAGWGGGGEGQSHRKKAAQLLDFCCCIREGLYDELPEMFTQDFLSPPHLLGIVLCHNSLVQLQ